jgi:hypothetical protein
MVMRTAFNIRHYLYTTMPFLSFSSGYSNTASRQAGIACRVPPGHIAAAKAACL